VVGREFGFNRYEHIQDFDFAAGDHYLTATEALWRAVRDEWNVMLARAEPVRLKGAPDRDRMFIPLFEMAEQLNATQSPAAFATKRLQNEARAKVRAYLAPVDAAIASR
jgi:hypothetical protein